MDFIKKIKNTDHKGFLISYCGDLLLFWTKKKYVAETRYKYGNLSMPSPCPGQVSPIKVIATRSDFHSTPSSDSHIAPINNFRNAPRGLMKWGITLINVLTLPLSREEMHWSVGKCGEKFDTFLINMAHIMGTTFSSMFLLVYGVQHIDTCYPMGSLSES